VVYATDFPKYYDKKTLDGMLRKILGEKYGGVKLAVSYGSRRPYSDIDILIVSDKIEPAFNWWLDLAVIPEAEFKRLLGLLDISVTDPLFSGNA